MKVVEKSEIYFFLSLGATTHCGFVFCSLLACSRTRFLDHTQRRATVGRTPLDEWSVRRRDLYLTAHNTHDKHPSPSGVRTHDLSRRAAVDLRLRPRGHWDRQIYVFVLHISFLTFNGFEITEDEVQYALINEELRTDKFKTVPILPILP